MSAIAGAALALAGATWLASQFREKTWFDLEPIYIQGVVGAVVFLIFGGLVYWFVYRKHSTSEFLIATEGEMRKVNWSTRREVIGSTIVVISISLVISLLLFVSDAMFASFFKLINVLESGSSDA
ncbi:MAG: preprotein translocase subunit SecE [Phycisphaerales bacterium JB038]